MLELIETKSGINLRIKVSPNAKREGVLGAHGDGLKVAVSAQPEKGKANKAVIKVLAKALGVSPGSISIIRGQTNSQKVVAIEGLTIESAREKLLSLL